MSLIVNFDKPRTILDDIAASLVCVPTVVLSQDLIPNLCVANAPEHRSRIVRSLVRQRLQVLSRQIHPRPTLDHSCNDHSFHSIEMDFATDTVDAASLVVVATPDD